MNKLFVLISESYQEMVNKVTWPSLSSLQSSSVLVLIASLIFALFIGLIDLGFENVMSLFYETF
ncbi:MAG: preprotein translocase subunit SecE [Bacteroidota bacterium]|jgi:preprotein translocase subunit SecE|nr:preprotein translocase subunit SecE [Bacteroidota bacterium]